MNFGFQKEERLLNRLVLGSIDMENKIGLLTGQMGIIIVLALYARHKKKPFLEEAADYLFDNMVNKLNCSYGIGLASGIAGINWGVEFLVQKGLMPGSADDLCKNLDEYIILNDIFYMTDFSLDNGLLGLWYSIWSRIQGNLIAGLPLPFNERYLDNWEIVLKNNKEKFPAQALNRLKDARLGVCYFEQAEINKFIELPTELDQKNLSLKNGIAGYIYMNYLK